MVSGDYVNNDDTVKMGRKQILISLRSFSIFYSSIIMYKLLRSSGVVGKGTEDGAGLTKKPIIMS